MRKMPFCVAVCRLLKGDLRPSANHCGKPDITDKLIQPERKARIYIK